MKNTIFWLCIFCFSILSCDEIADNGSSGSHAQAGVSGQPSTTTSAASVRNMEKLGQVVSCNSINKKIADAGDDATWINSPFQIALEFAGDQMESRKKVISAETVQQGERFDDLIITVEEEGLLDDSVGGTMLILRMNKKGAGWEVTKASRLWKCWPGRGHTEFSSEPCS